MDDPDRHALPETENARIFREEIVPDHFEHGRPQEHPVLVVLVGQQGAGKSRHAPRIGDRLDRYGGYVEIDSDVYKAYHPAYVRLLAEDDRLMAAYTAIDGQRWHHQAQFHARRRRLNVLIQETAQNPPYLAEVARAYRRAGYHVAMEFLGVPEAMSRQAILHRYHEQVLDRGRGRLTIPAKRAAAFRGILDLADLVDEHRFTDEVSVRRRGDSLPRYANHLTATGGWARTARLRKAIEDERARPWSDAEAADFRAVQRRLESELGPDFQPELGLIRDLAEPEPVSSSAQRRSSPAARRR